MYVNSEVGRPCSILSALAILRGDCSLRTTAEPISADFVLSGFEERLERSVAFVE